VPARFSSQVLALYSSGRFVRVFADARGGGGLFVIIRQSGANSVSGLPTIPEASILLVILGNRNRY
jgi:hypothetical protein